MKALLVASVQSHIAQFHRPLIKVLKEKGFTIDVAARDNLDEKNGLKIENVDHIFDVPFHRSPIKKQNRGAFTQLKKIINEGNYDIISCNTPVASVLTRIAANNARKQGTRVFYMAHGFHFCKGAPFKNKLLYYPVEKFCSRFTDVLITINKEDYDLSKKKMKAKKLKSHQCHFLHHLCFRLKTFSPKKVEQSLLLLQALSVLLVLHLSCPYQQDFIIILIRFRKRH
jgi:glycosyltransferase EpsD